MELLIIFERNLYIDSMAKKKNVPKIAFCVPTLNEEENILPLYYRFKELQKDLDNQVHLVLQFTDNASSDGSWELIKSIVRNDSSVSAFRFGRNIGFQESILFNLINNDADAAMQLDADLQDPIELFPEFYLAWKSGFKVVSGLREDRMESIFSNFLRKFGYRVIERLSEYPVTADVGDFRLLDREVIDSLREIRTRSPYLRAVISSYGFPEKLIPYTRVNRLHGESKFRFFSLIKFGMNGLLGHSRVMLRVYNFISLILSMVLVGFLIWIIGRAFLGFETPSGYVTIVTFVTFVALLVSIGITLVLSYLFRIYEILNGESGVHVEKAQ
jgi:glycosyltransferase involved in cell wall biosynthesis